MVNLKKTKLKVSKRPKITLSRNNRKKIQNTSNVRVVVKPKEDMKERIIMEKKEDKKEPNSIQNAVSKKLPEKGLASDQNTGNVDSEIFLNQNKPEKDIIPHHIPLNDSPNFSIHSNSSKNQDFLHDSLFEDLTFESYQRTTNIDLEKKESNICRNGQNLPHEERTDFTSVPDQDYSQDWFNKPPTKIDISMFKPSSFISKTNFKNHIGELNVIGDEIQEKPEYTENALSTKNNSKTDSLPFIALKKNTKIDQNNVHERNKAIINSKNLNNDLKDKVTLEVSENNKIMNTNIKSIARNDGHESIKVHKVSTKIPQKNTNTSIRSQHEVLQLVPLVNQKELNQISNIDHKNKSNMDTQYASREDQQSPNIKLVKNKNEPFQMKTKTQKSNKGVQEKSNKGDQEKNNKKSKKNGNKEENKNNIQKNNLKTKKKKVKKINQTTNKIPIQISNEKINQTGLKNDKEKKKDPKTSEIEESCDKIINSEKKKDYYNDNTEPLIKRIKNDTSKAEFPLNPNNCFISRYSLLNCTTSRNEPIFNHLDLPMPANIPTELNSYLKAILKKSEPFKNIYSNFLVGLLSKTENFFTENSFCKVSQIDNTQNFTPFKYENIGPIQEISHFDLKTPKIKNISYDDRLISNKPTIFITDQCYSNLMNENFLFLFSIRSLISKIIKFLDYKVSKINFEESLELFAYSKMQTATPNVQICESTDIRIVIQCNSFFKMDLKDQSINSFYFIPNKPSNIKLVLLDDRIVPKRRLLPHKHNEAVYLNLLAQLLNLPDGDYVLKGNTVYKKAKEGEVFSVEGLTLEEFIDI